MRVPDQKPAAEEPGPQDGEDVLMLAAADEPDDDEPAGPSDAPDARQAALEADHSHADQAQGQQAAVPAAKPAAKRQSKAAGTKRGRGVSPLQAQLSSLDLQHCTTAQCKRVCCPMLWRLVSCSGDVAACTTLHSQTVSATAGGLPQPKAGGKKSRLGPQAKAAAEAVDVQAEDAVLPSQVPLNLHCTLPLP